jgi:ParB family chromosome partitioning protein
MPQDDQALWDWLTALDDTSRLALLAHCVSYGVDTLYEKADRYGGPGVSQSGVDRRLSQADRLAHAVGLDMVEAGWKPTVDNYLGRVPKRRILEAVRDGAGERAAQLIDHLKKGEMAKEAERLLGDTGWLAEPLRLTNGDSAAEVASTDGEAEALPEFLAGDDGETAPDDTEEPQPQVAAAE